MRFILHDLVELVGVAGLEVARTALEVEPAALGGSPGRLRNGHGVLLIESLADRSGHFTDEKGRLHTWFELD